MPLALSLGHLPHPLSHHLCSGLASLAAASASCGREHLKLPLLPRRPAALRAEVYSMAAASHAAEWKVPAEQDGWVLSHDALRLDLSDLERLVDALQVAAAAGRPPSAEQLAVARAAWQYHAHMLTVHHDTEEELYFPLLRTRFAVPDKQSADHQSIVGLMQECGRGFKAAGGAAGTPAAAAKLEALRASFRRFKSLCEAHYREEEAETLPLIRQHFAPEEVTPTAKMIAKAYNLRDMGNYLRPMTPEQRTAWMTRVRMPFFVQWLMQLQVWLYDRQVVQPLERAIQQARQA